MLNSSTWICLFSVVFRPNRPDFSSLFRRKKTTFLTLLNEQPICPIKTHIFSERKHLILSGPPIPPLSLSRSSRFDPPTDPEIRYKCRGSHNQIYILAAKFNYVYFSKTDWLTLPKPFCMINTTCLLWTQGDPEWPWETTLFPRLTLLMGLVL